MNLAKKLTQLLTKKPVATIDQLCSATGRAEITVKQALAKLDYLTSYDHNSRFYALRSTCRFDQNGIWKHKSASFTHHGTLAALLLAIVDESDDGRTASELETTTGTAVSGVLRRLVKEGRLVRVRWQREYVYLTARSKRRRQHQAKARFGSSKPLAHAEEDATTEVLKKTIVILLEIIRSRPRTMRDLKETLGKRHPEIPGAMVTEVCRQYGVSLKKKIDPLFLFDSAVTIARTLEARTGKTAEFHFASGQQYCPSCGRPTEYYKTTRPRTVQTLRFGEIRFRESQRRCPIDRHDMEDGSSLIYGSAFLRSLAPARASIGFDVIVEIGRLRFIEYRQVEEVCEALQAQGITCSPSSVSRWADFFLAAVECLHYTKTNKLRRLLDRNGGYVLHIDATTESKSDTVFVCIDRVLGAVLLTEKISSENEEEVTKALRRLKALFGRPRCIMRDMSGRLANAVQEVFAGVPDRICQFHFLRDIGKDMLGKAYVQMGRTMVRLKINAHLRKMKRELEKTLPVEQVQRASALFRETSTLEGLQTSSVREHEAVFALRLVNWCLDHTSDGEGLGLPFDLYRVYYCSRINRTRLRLARYARRHPRIMKRCPRLQQLQEIAARVNDYTLRRELREIRALHRHFQRLRAVFRFEVTPTAPLASTMSVGSIKEIRAYNRGLVAYTKQLLEAESRGKIADAEKIILKHLKTYQFKLPIPEQLAELLSRGYLDRTNNFEESMFRDVKRGQRRQVGKKDISREFSLHGPYLPLMRNLTNEHYVAAVVGGINDLPVRISELNPREIGHYLQKLRENRRGKFFECINDFDAIELLPTRT